MFSYISRFLNRWVLVLFSIFMVSCDKKNNAEKDNEIDITQNESQLLYDYTFHLTDDDVFDGAINQDVIHTFFGSVCTSIVYGHQFLEPQEYQSNFVKYRWWSCVADMANKYATSGESTTVSRVYKFPNSIKTFEFGPAFPEGFVHDGIYYNQEDIEVVELHPLDTLQKKEEILHYAMLAYVNSLLRGFKAIGNLVGTDDHAKVQRCSAYIGGIEDYVYRDEYPDDSNGVALYYQLFSDIPTLLNTIADIKIKLAEMHLNEGVFRRDEWSSEEYGRIPALRHLIGTISAENTDSFLPFTTPPVEVFPGAIVNTPDLTNNLLKAIHLIGKYLDFSSWPIYEPDSTIEEMLEDIKTEILTNANAGRTEAELPLYTHATLTQEYGTTEAAYVDALRYMFVHLYRFPRLQAVDIDSGEAELDWTHKYTRLLWHIYISKFFNTGSNFVSNILKDYDGWVTDEEVLSIPKEIGLYDLLVFIEEAFKEAEGDFNPIDFATECLAALPGAEIVENKIYDTIDITQESIDKVIGKNNISATAVFDDVASQFDVNVVIENCENTYDYGSVSKTKVYGISDQSSILKYEEISCSLTGDETIEPCATIMSSVAEEDFVVDPATGTCEANVQDLAPKSIYVIEIQKEESLDWIPVGIIYTGDIEDDTPLSIRLPVDGQVVDMVKKILHFDADDVNTTDCVTVNGLDGMCIDRDWVPAIDNETIDSSGNQYEESYKHYLQLADMAAKEARSLRETLMNDIVTEAHDKGLEAAQKSSAIDIYFNRIEEICGDTTNVDQNSVRDIFEETSGATANTIRSYIDNLWGIEPLNESLTYANYGCIDGDYRKGYVQCAAQRNCSIDQPSSIENLIGSLKNNPWSFLDTTSLPEYDEELLDYQTDYYESYDELFDGEQYKFDVPTDDNSLYFAIEKQLMEKIDILEEEKNSRLSTIMSYKFYGIPMGPMTWSTYGSDTPVYGKYLQKISEFKMELLNLRTAIEEYAAVFDKAVAGLKILRNDLLTMMNNYNIQELRNWLTAVTQITTLSLQQSQSQEYGDMQWKQCMNVARDKYGSQQGTKIVTNLIEDGLNQLNIRLEEDYKLEFIDSASVSELLDKRYFRNICADAIQRINHPAFNTVPEAPEIVCEHLADRGLSAASHTNWGSDYFLREYDCDSVQFLQKPRDFLWDNDEDMDENEREEIIEDFFEYWEGGNGENIYLMCAADPAAYNENDVCYTSFSEELGRLGRNYRFYDACLTRSTQQPNVLFWVWIDIGRFDLQEIVDLLIDQATKNCNVVFGCDPWTKWDDECKSIFGDEFESQMDTQKTVAKEIDRVMERLERSETILKMTDQFRQTMIDVGTSFRKGKNEINNSIKNISRIISQINDMETDQIHEMEQLINNVNIASATSYSTLSEWNERYDYRKKEYEKQLERAKIAAWIARRSIEFRFGIDLSKEVTRTIYGDIPEEWADDIFVITDEACGEEPAGDLATADNTKITQCLSKEDRIEDYVQKLEDYVASYGNTPEQEWWFHEDDDIGIISLRDNIAVGNITPTSSVNNLLYFTEEMNMTQDAFEEQYADILDRFYSDKGERGAAKELPVPSIWQGNATVISDTEISAALGMPGVDIKENKNNQDESALYFDMLEQSTADQVNFHSADGTEGEYGLSQDVNHELLVSEAVNPEVDMMFSAYMKKAPVETSCKEGQLFSEKLGRCGIPCDPEDTPACPHDGQSCTETGYKEVEEGGETVLAPQYICTWCSADRNCIGQDGTVVEMTVQNEIGDDVVKARRKVAVGNRWARRAVNTVEDIYEIEPETDLDNLTVYIGNTTTENLVTASEKIDTDKGWFIEPPCTILTQSETSPDGYENTDVASITSDGTFGGSGKVGYLANINESGEYYTASIWIKIAEGTPEESLDIKMEMYNDLGDLLGFTQEEAEKEWKRISVRGYAEEGDAQIYFKVGTDTTTAGQYDLSIWGAQIEEGTEPTVYLPTGKNHLPSKSLETDWIVNNGAQVIKVDNIKSPDEKIGIEANVYKITDDSLGEVGFLSYQVSGAGALGGYTGTFSIWVRTENGTTSSSRINIDSQSANLTWTLVEANEEWQRYTVTIDVAPAELVETTVRIYPAYPEPMKQGSIYVWGPQLESGIIATGYQETNSIVDDNSRYWSPEVGLVGTQLSVIGTIECDIFGNAVTGDGTHFCPVIEDTKNYIRNTYFRQHYSEKYAIKKKGDEILYPTPGELIVRLTDKEKNKEFKEQFKYYEGDENIPGYYQFNPFNIDIESIENGSLGMFGIIADDNFNHRIKTVAVNIVGTDVINCSRSQSPATCAANNWLSYDLKQMGDVRIRNHHKEKTVREFNIPNGRISGGKALTAEQVIGHPISSAHQSMLGQMQKVSLMGRPIEGTYELRIKDIPELEWDNIRDIQLILGYHYWTRSE